MVQLKISRLLLAGTVFLTSPCTAGDQQQTLPHGYKTDQTSRRVAIIGRYILPLPLQKLTDVAGAGSAGTSTAYYLHRYASENLSTTIFESSSHIGGRSTTVNAFDDPLYPVELGASIFVKANRNLVSAAERFNLITDEAFGDRPKHSSYDLGIWNGKEFVYTQSRGSSWWADVAKLIWQYGVAPIQTQRLMKSTVGKFLKLYDKPYFPFRDLSREVQDLGLVDFTSHTGEQVLESRWISQKFATEIIQSATRVNYGQNLNLIHGLETMVCMATDGAMSVKGGNWQIFDRMARTSGANLRLNTTVSGITRHDDRTYTVEYRRSSDLSSEPQSDDFDAVILAAPYHSSNISVNPNLSSPPDKILYVDLHVTLLASPHRLSPLFFSLSDVSEVPEVILTTLPPGMKPAPTTNNTQTVGPSPFWSISTLGVVQRADSGEDLQNHYVYKIFSPEPVNSTLLSTLLSFELSSSEHDLPLTSIPKENVSWLYTKAWQSYPFEFPRVTFENIQLDDYMFYYTAGIESFISTMETSSLMGRNVAALIARDWEEEPFWDEDCGNPAIARDEARKWEL